MCVCVYIYIYIILANPMTSKTPQTTTVKKQINIKTREKLTFLRNFLRGINSENIYFLMKKIPILQGLLKLGVETQIMVLVMSGPKVF